MKQKLFFYLYFCVLLGFISCNEELNDESKIKGEIQKESVVPPNVAGMIRFSEILSKAIKEHSDIRSFLKTEALKMMDNDYDIFYPRSKNETVSYGKSFRDILSEYVENDEELTAIEKSLPLLTIYIPELPSGFDASIWDAENEIPTVASTVVRNDSIDFYYDGTTALSLKSSEIPGWPTLVIKNNERIRLKNKDIITPALRSSSGDDDYEFIDEAFNGQLISFRSVTLSDIVTAAQYPALIPAYNEMGVDNNCWQRDYIYYGMTKQTGATGFGYINRRFSERIAYIKFSPDAYTKMSDQAGDPSYALALGVNNITPNLWTDGKFEIKIDVIINNLLGIGTTITKYFSVSPRDIFDVQYEKVFVSAGVYLYRPTGVTSLTYQPNIDLVTWDLETNGFGWKFVISEIDDQTTETLTATVNTEYATNFGMTASGMGKIGLNFGMSAKRSQTNTYTLVTTKGADDLGTVEFYFSDPVIISHQPYRSSIFQPVSYKYSLYSKSNPYVELTIIPVQLY